MVAPDGGTVPGGTVVTESSATGTSTMIVLAVTDPEGADAPERSLVVAVSCPAGDGLSEVVPAPTAIAAPAVARVRVTATAAAAS